MQQQHKNPPSPAEQRYTESHTDTVHVAEDACESAFIRYPGADEIIVVTGSSQNSADVTVHYACYEVMTSGF